MNRHADRKLREPRPANEAVLRMVYEGFETKEMPRWTMTKSATLLTEGGGRILRVTGSGRAMWHIGYFGDSRLDFRYRAEGTGIVEWRMTRGRRGEQGYQLRLGAGHIALVRKDGDERWDLAEVSTDVSFDGWVDFTIWTFSNKIVVALNGEAVLEALDKRPIPPGVLAFGAEEAEYADFDQLRLLELPGNFIPPSKPEKPAEGYIVVLPEQPGKPEIPIGEIQQVQVVPFEVHPYKHAKRPTPINAGVVPPNYLHSWSIDLSDVQSFKLFWQSKDDIQLHWDPGSGLDRLSVIDTDGQVIHTFTSQHDLENQGVVLPAQAGSAGKYRRIYLLLETSHVDQPRRFQLHGLLNLNPSTGAEEALLLGDDLNYDVKLGPFFETVDPNGKNIAIYQPWLPAGPNTFSVSYEEPSQGRGWYLLGKNTSDTERTAGFLTLLYYNERLGRLRVYLFNMNLPSTVTGYLVSLLLRGRKENDFVDLEGAFFSYDPRPDQWSRATIPIPLWPIRTWISFEVPVLYPMAKELPSRAGGPVGGLPSHYYQSVYEDYCSEAHQNIRLRVVVQGFTQGDVEGDIVGKAIGEAVQTQSSSSGLSISDLARGVAAMYSSGKDWYGAGKWLFDKATEFHERQLKANDPDAPVLGALLSLGAGAWSGALAAVGIGVAIYQTYFSPSDPLRLAIQMAIKAHLTGKVTTMFQPTRQDFFLPGRFSIVQAAGEDPIYDLDYMDTIIPRYDRTLGLFGVRYDPSQLEFDLLETYYSRDEYQDDTRYVFPSTLNFKTLDPPTPNGRRSLRRWLPVIYNPYAEIVPMMPVKDGILLPTAEEQVDWGKDWISRFLQDGIPPNQPWFKWLMKIAPADHIIPEPGDKSFPLQTPTIGSGPRAWVKVFSAQPTGLFYDPLLAYLMAFRFELDEGIWLDVFPESRITPATYRTFQEIDDVRTHTFWDVNVSTIDPDPNASDIAPWPWHDVLYCWEVPYFYYGRTRKNAQGDVPLEKNILLLQVPVTFFYQWTFHEFTDNEGGWVPFPQPLKSRILMD